MSEKITTPGEMVRFLDDVKEQIASLKRKHAESRQPDPVPTSVTHSCAACSVEFPHVGEREVEVWFAKHGKVCERRPLGVGDRVRWTSSDGRRWLDGQIVAEMNHSDVRVTCKEFGGEWFGSPETGYSYSLARAQCRRIPRPVDEVKAGPVGFAEQGCDPEMCANCGEHIRNHYGGTEYRCNPKSLIESVCADHTASPPPVTSPDPLDVVIDGDPLRHLLACDELSRREGYRFSPSLAQRAAVSAHWSAELRLKVAASDAARKEREVTVVIGLDGEDFPW